MLTSRGSVCVRLPEDHRWSQEIARSSAVHSRVCGECFPFAYMQIAVLGMPRLPVAGQGDELDDRSDRSELCVLVRSCGPSGCKTAPSPVQRCCVRVPHAVCAYRVPVTSIHGTEDRVQLPGRPVQAPLAGDPLYTDPVSTSTGSSAPQSMYYY